MTLSIHDVNGFLSALDNARDRKGRKIAGIVEIATRVESLKRQLILDPDDKMATQEILEWSDAFAIGSFDNAG